MTEFGIQRLLPAQLVPDLTTMTAGFITSVKIWVIVVDLVGRPMLPLVELAFSVSFIAILAIGVVCRFLFSHSSSAGVKSEYADAREGSGCWTDGT